MEKLKFKITCINHGIEETQEINDLNEFFKYAGVDKEDYGDDYFKIEVINEEI